MPVVPYVRKEDARGQGFSPRKVTSAEEPWLLMAAAQMDQQGRLIEPNIDDRRGQGRKQTDDQMVEDQQRRDTGRVILNQLMDEKSGRESKLGRDLGAEDLKGD